jgi:hypothetical protein
MLCACAWDASKVAADAKALCIMKTRRVLENFEVMVIPEVKKK